MVMPSHHEGESSGTGDGAQASDAYNSPYRKALRATKGQDPQTQDASRNFETVAKKVKVDPTRNKSITS